jgi:drug/metabolite transporter (DMT)-like permease
MTGAPGETAAPSLLKRWGPFVLVTLIWSSTWLVIKDQIGLGTPGWSIALRFAIATVCMFALCAIRGDGWRLEKGWLPVVAIVGLCQFMGNFQLVYRAEIYLTSGIVAVFFALLLVPNAILARLVLGQRSSPRFVLGSAIAIAGILLLFVHEYRTAGISGGVVAGIVLATLGMLAASIANITQATPAAHRQPFMPLLAWSMALGTIVDAVMAYAMEGWPVWPDGWRYYAGVGYLAIVGSVATFPLYFGLVRTMGAGHAAYVGVAVPPIAMLLSTAFEGYRWSAMAAGGVGLAMIGLLIAMRTRPKPRGDDGKAEPPLSAETAIREAGE